MSLSVFTLQFGRSSVSSKTQGRLPPMKSHQRAAVEDGVIPILQLAEWRGHSLPNADMSQASNVQFLVQRSSPIGSLSLSLQIKVIYRFPFNNIFVFSLPPPSPARTEQWIACGPRTGETQFQIPAEIGSSLTQPFSRFQHSLLCRVVVANV